VQWYAIYSVILPVFTAATADDPSPYSHYGFVSRIYFLRACLVLYYDLAVNRTKNGHSTLVMGKNEQ
jgi:hypothetical protein